jgi:hypothetical protein
VYRKISLRVSYGRDPDKGNRTRQMFRKIAGSDKDTQLEDKFEGRVEYGKGDKMWKKLRFFSLSKLRRLYFACYFSQGKRKTSIPRYE